MARTWNITHGRPDFDFLETIKDALGADGDLISSNSRRVVVGDGSGQEVAFLGDFQNTDADPGPDSGEVNTVKVFDNGTLVAKATGYHLTVSDVADAVDLLKNSDDFSGLMNLFFNSGVPSGSVRITINGSDDRDVLKIPGDVPHTFYGNGGNDIFIGTASGDKIVGGSGNDILKGRGDDDVIKGNTGKDKLFGSTSNDHLFGGKGHDQFFFDTPLGNGFMKAGVDIIEDFKPGEDIIKLDKAVFSNIGNFLSASEFHLGGSAGDANDFILYKESSGALFYDPDGSGPMNRIKFAVLDNKPDLSHDDFLMV